MKILLLAQHYAPEEVSGAVLATELAADLVCRGHSVSFVTAAPSYPLGRVFPGYRNTLLSRRVEDGVRVLRVWSYISPRRAFWARALNFASFTAFALLGGLAARRPNVIFSYSPPLPLGLAAWLLARLYRAPWVLRVEDLFPDAAVAVGVLRGKRTIRFFRNVERFLYARADRISVISEGFRDNLVRKGVPAGKISVEPVWADPDVVSPLPKDNSFRAEQGLDKQFVVLYSGNLGHAAALDEILSAAHILRDDPSFAFLIVGEGERKAELQEQARRLALPNLRFLPFQPRERLSEMLSAADVNLVTLNSRSAGYSLPCKTFTNMASARPILAVTPLESDLAELVRAAGCGMVVPPGDPAAFVAALRTLRDDLVGSDQMGWRGREILLSKFSRQHCIDQYEDTIRMAVEYPVDHS